MKRKMIYFIGLILLFSSCLTEGEEFFLNILKERTGSKLNEKNIKSQEIKDYVFIGKKGGGYHFVFKKWEERFIPMTYFNDGKYLNSVVEILEKWKEGKGRIDWLSLDKTQNKIEVEYHEHGDFLKKKRQLFDI